MSDGLKMIEFTAAHGFRMTEQEFTWLPGEDEKQFFARLGFEVDPSRDGLDSERDFREVLIYYAKGDPSPWYAAVDPADGDRSVYIFVANPAELIELRLRLLPWNGLAFMQRLEALAELAKKAFTAWHGHDPMYPCETCDPYEYKLEMERRERRRNEQRQATKASSGP